MTKKCGAMLVGAAKVDITPKDLSGLTNLWRTPFEGVHDPIFARALVLDNGINIAAIITADLVEFGDTSSLRRQIESEIGIPFQNIVITASHDHNAPRVGTTTPGATAQKGGPATERYTKEVYNKIIEAIKQSQSALQPARVGVGKGTADLNVNRNLFTAEGWQMGANPDGPSDKTLWVVKFETLEGQPIAMLVNYAVHSVFIGPNNSLVTGDFAGAVERYVEQSHQDKVVVLWTMGAAADQNPKYMDLNPDHKDNEEYYALMNSLARILGEEILAIEKEIPQNKSEIVLAAEERIVTLPARIPPRDANLPGMEVEKVDSLDLRLGLLLIDQIALTWIAGEVVTKIYWRLQSESPFTNTLMITLANDRLGYIVDDAGYHTPTFESTASPLQPGHAESTIINNLVEMISQC